MENSMGNQVEILRNEIKTQNRRQRVWLAIFCIVSFLVLITVISVSLAFIDSDFVKNLQAKNTSVTRNVDYLQFVVPVLLAMGAFMAAALGINRLKNLDDQIEKIEHHLEDRFKQYENNSSSSIDNRISIEITKKSEGYISALEVKANESKGQLNDIIADAKEKINDLTNEAGKQLELKKNASLGSIEHCIIGLEEKVNNSKELLDTFDNEYGWLKNNEGHIAPDDITVQSVDDAHRMVEELFRKSNISKNTQAKQVRVIAQKVLNEQIAGDSADYHNLTAELARNELKDVAVSICVRGLKSFPQNEDLLADIILYITQIGEETAGVAIQQYIDQLLAIDRKSWTWRCFEFLADYYIAIKQYKSAEEICLQYIEYLPRDERGYAQLAEIYGYMYYGIKAENKKIGILKIAVEKGFPCPRCANQLANLYGNRGELENAIKCSNVAILSLAQSQPSVNYAYVLYEKALFEDRLFLKKRMDGDEDVSLAESALNDYKLALKSGGLSSVTNTQAKTRYNLIADYIGVEKYPINDLPSERLMSLLTHLNHMEEPDQE